MACLCRNGLLSDSGGEILAVIRLWHIAGEKVAQERLGHASVVKCPFDRGRPAPWRAVKVSGAATLLRRECLAVACSPSRYDFVG